MVGGESGLIADVGGRWLLSANRQLLARVENIYISWANHVTLAQFKLITSLFVLIVTKGGVLSCQKLTFWPESPLSSSSPKAGVLARICMGF